MEMPEIANTEEIAKYLKIKPKTVYNYTYSKVWKQGIYIGRGRYNLTKLKEFISTPPHRYLTNRGSDFCNDLKK